MFFAPWKNAPILVIDSTSGALAFVNHTLKDDKLGTEFFHGAAASGASSTAGGRSVSSGLGKSPGLNRIGGAPEWRLTHLKDDADASRASRTDVDPYTSPAVTGLGRVVSTLGAMIPAPGPGGWGLPRELFETKSKHEGDFAGGRPYDCVCWSPCGRLLAAGSADRRATAVWEVSTGARCSIASGVAGVSGLAWSPCGRYLFASHPTGGFTLWETEGWTAAKWWTDGAAVIAAAWGPEPPPDDPNRHDGGDGAGATLLVTTRRGRGQVSAVHLPRRGPALAAQLLPVELPQFTGEDGAEVLGGSAQSTRAAANAATALMAASMSVLVVAGDQS